MPPAVHDAPAQAPLACAWCGAPLDPHRAVGRGRLGCATCGAATTHPWPDDAALARAYDSYRPPGGRFSGPGDAFLRRSRAMLARRLDRLAPPGPILDVGSGDGALLDGLRARGRRAQGLERDPSAAAARDDVRAAELDDVDGEWAAIVFWHSLEHLRRPGEALDRAAALLAPGGVVVVAMPNAASLQARAFGDGWLALDLPRHLVHVPAATLLERLRANGLRVERVSHVRGGQIVFGWLHGLVGSLPGHPDLYEAIRRAPARQGPLTPARRALALGAGALALVPAGAGAAAEVVTRRGGSVYVEARHG